MWGNICLLGTLTIFGYLHLICIARNATRLLLLLPPTTTPTPLGMTTTTTTTPLSTLCTALCIRVVFQMTGALRCAAQSIFGMSLPITPFQYLRRILSTFLFCFVPPPFLSPSLSLSCIVACSGGNYKSTRQNGDHRNVRAQFVQWHRHRRDTVQRVGEERVLLQWGQSTGIYCEYTHTQTHTHTLRDKRISRVFSSIAPLRFSFSFFFFLWRYMNMQFLTMGKNVDWCCKKKNS